MINLYSAHIASLSIHRVGNKSKNEPLLLSEEMYKTNDEITPLLKEFFLKPFRDKEENYFQFGNDVDVEFNELFKLTAEVFANPESIHENSKKITQHLYDQSTHQHIKSGEVYVAFFEGLQIDNEKVNGIGIFKSEIKQDFLQFSEKENQLEAILQQGVSLIKLDKGCLIFDVKKEEGYKILSVDSNRYDAKYWLESFLGVDACNDDNFKTKRYSQKMSYYQQKIKNRKYYL
jgi:hypothetical protein